MYCPLSESLRHGKGVGNEKCGANFTNASKRVQVVGRCGGQAGLEARLELPPWKPWCPGVASDEAVLELRSGIVLAEAVVGWLNKSTLLTQPTWPYYYYILYCILILSLCSSLISSAGQGINFVTAATFDMHVGCIIVCGGAFSRVLRPASGVVICL